MIELCPPWPSPLLSEPGTWPGLVLASATCLLEAEGEPDDGIVAVGWVLRHRALRWKRSLHAVILGLDGLAYDDGGTVEPFSAWNNDYRVQAAHRLEFANADARERAWRSACIGWWGLGIDPSDGADHYLNISATKAARGGHLPKWAADRADSTRLNTHLVTVVLGRQTFLRLLDRPEVT